MVNIVSLGNFGPVVGTDFVAGLGNNPVIDPGTPEDIWAGGGNYPWMTAATSLEIVSSSANDAAAGTGARTVLIEGLDANYLQVDQIVTLNGLTAVAIPTQLYRINSAMIVSAGSGGVNAGVLTIRDAGAGTTRELIPLGFGRDRSSNYTVPAAHTLYLSSLFYCINRPSSVRDATISFVIRQQNGATSLTDEVGIDGNPFQRILGPAAPLSEKLDFIFRATSVSQAATDITASWLGILRDN